MDIYSIPQQAVNDRTIFNVCIIGQQNIESNKQNGESYSIFDFCTCSCSFSRTSFIPEFIVTSLVHYLRLHKT